jgi:hypothetical protein
VNEFRVYYRAARAFRVGSRTVARGEVVRADDPLVERVNTEEPDLLLITIRSTRPSSPRPQEVAGVRSSARDLLAGDPSWRLP